VQSWPSRWAWTLLLVSSGDRNAGQSGHRRGSRVGEASHLQKFLFL
jgi:hypothetical protein